MSPLIPPQLHIQHYGAVSQRHDHAHHQLVLPREGCLQLKVGRKAQCLVNHQGAFIPAGQAHEFSSAEANGSWVLDVSAATLRRLGLPEDLSGLDRQHFFQLSPALQQHMAFLGAQPAVDAQFTEHWSALLLMTLARGDLPALQQPTDPLLTYIKAHLAEPLSLASLAKRAHLSESQFQRRFRQQHGTSVKQYITQRRLQKAEQLLQQTRRPIAEVASDCGFHDQAALTRALRQHRHSTPAAMRKSAPIQP